MLSSAVRGWVRGTGIRSNRHYRREALGFATLVLPIEQTRQNGATHLEPPRGPRLARRGGIAVRGPVLAWWMARFRAWWVAPLWPLRCGGIAVRGPVLAWWMAPAWPEAVGLGSPMANTSLPARPAGEAGASRMRFEPIQTWSSAKFRGFVAVHTLEDLGNKTSWKEQLWES
jgi:hypothetical protein